MSNNNSFLDALNVASFLIGVANYNENLTQTDKQELMSGVDKQTSVLLSELHAHLDSQDKKIDKILTMLGEKTFALIFRSIEVSYGFRGFNHNAVDFNHA